MNVKLYANLTRQFLRFLEELKPEEIASLESRESRVEIRLSGPKRSEGKPHSGLTPEDLSKLGSELRAAATNERAATLLSGLNKEQLTRLSRALDLPVQKSDTIDQIRERVVQSTVGFRLRSKAIQG